MAYVVEHADMGMIEVGNGFGFALETLFANGVRTELRGENLDGDAAIQTRIFGAINLSHPARTERDTDLVRTKSCTWRERHLWRDYTPGKPLRGNSDRVTSYPAGLSCDIVGYDLRHE